MRFATSIGTLAFLAGCAATSVNTQPREARPIPWPPEKMAENWTVTQNGQGQLVVTGDWHYGVVDRTLTIVLQEDSLTPVSGTKRYPNGHRGAMTPEELKLFWESGGAQHAVERHKAASH